jgi:pimeloyl-ACP methyl ester carboxylesterase
MGVFLCTMPYAGIMKPVARRICIMQAQKENTYMLTVQNTETYVVDEGQGRPTLFLHGIPDSADMWRGVMDEMQGSARLIAVDLPGYGRSVAPAGYAPSLEGMASWINDLLDALNIREAVNLVVTDLGGTFGIAFAVRHPERVRRLALVGATNFFPDYQWHRIAKMLRIPLLGELAMSAMSYDTFKKSVLDSNNHDPVFTDELLHSTYEMGFARPFVRTMTLRYYRALDTRQFAAWQPGLKAFVERVPMLILWGDRDPYIAPAFAERYGAKEVHHFAEYGHWIAMQAPHMVAEHLKRFFS